jgi:hypothetical protein
VVVFTSVIIHRTGTALSDDNGRILSPLVQMSLNHTLVVSLGTRVPITVFTGLPGINPLDVAFLPLKTLIDVRLTADQVAVLTEKLRASLQSMHKDMDCERNKGNVGDVGDVDVDFRVGDYVLWADACRRHYLALGL